jgi:hypothetical protein
LPCRTRFITEPASSGKHDSKSKCWVWAFAAAEQWPPQAPLFSFSFAVAGIRTFNGDGTGTVTGTAVSTTSPNFNPNASSDNFTFHFTYVVNVDGSWTSDMVPGTYMGTFVTGPRSTPSQQTYTIEKLPTLSGLTGVNGLTMTAAGLTPSVETHIFSNGDVWPMICHRSRMFTKLQPAS